MSINRREMALDCLAALSWVAVFLGLMLAFG
jgi:hypothetical protein